MRALGLFSNDFSFLLGVLTPTRHCHFRPSAPHPPTHTHTYSPSVARNIICFLRHFSESVPKRNCWLWKKNVHLKVGRRPPLIWSPWGVGGDGKEVEGGGDPRVLPSLPSLLFPLRSQEGWGGGGGGEGVDADAGATGEGTRGCLQALVQLLLLPLHPLFPSSW